MTRQTAEQVSKTMLELGARLNESVALVQSSESEAVFREYRAVVAGIMGTMLLDIMNPIYAEYPDLKPMQLEPV